MLVKVDEIQNRIKEDLKSEEEKNLQRDKQRTDTIKRIGKEINKSVKKVINDIGFSVSNRDVGKGSTGSSFGQKLGIWSYCMTHTAGSNSKLIVRGTLLKTLKMTQGIRKRF